MIIFWGAQATLDDGKVQVYGQGDGKVRRLMTRTPFKTLDCKEVLGVVLGDIWKKGSGY